MNTGHLVVPPLLVSRGPTLSYQVANLRIDDACALDQMLISNR